MDICNDESGNDLRNKEKMLLIILWMFILVIHFDNAFLINVVITFIILTIATVIDISIIKTMENIIMLLTVKKRHRKTIKLTLIITFTIALFYLVITINPYYYHFSFAS